VRKMKFRVWIKKAIKEPWYDMVNGKLEEIERIVEEANQMLYSKDMANGEWSLSCEGKKDFYIGFNGQLMMMKWDYSDTDIVPVEEDKYVLMGFADTEDIDGKEIYESDIVEDIYTGDRWIVKWVSGGFALQDGPDGDFEPYPICTYNLKVLGNIYENLELLEGENAIGG